MGYGKSLEATDTTIERHYSISITPHGLYLLVRVFYRPTLSETFIMASGTNLGQEHLVVNNMPLSL